MILIADSGATKIDWRAILSDGSILELSSEGINPVFQSKESIIDILRQTLIFQNEVKEMDIYFYGAGVVSLEISSILDSCFKELFPNSICHIESDLLAAARALCGHKAGIACILGTGSNTCFYDGEKITDNVKAGGFILGDEGSGAYFGKRLISDFIKGLLPYDIAQEFSKRFGLDYMKIVQKVYREPIPSRFLASFSPFIYEFKSDSHIRSILESGFDEFLQRNVSHYDYQSYNVNLVGSIAHYYRDILTERASIQGMKIGKILDCPISGLTDYYLQNDK